MLGRIIVAVFFALALGACTVSESQVSEKIEAQAKQIAEIQAKLGAMQKAGRYQVMNGTPSFARNIMLVDTETGRVWLACETKAGQSSTNTNWCAMDFYGTPSSPQSETPGP